MCQASKLGSIEDRRLTNQGAYQAKVLLRNAGIWVVLKGHVFENIAGRHLGLQLLQGTHYTH
jgi:hypothetical protein